MASTKRYAATVLGVLLIGVGVLLGANLYLEHSYRSYCEKALQTVLEVALEEGDESEVERIRERQRDPRNCQMF